VTIPGWLTSTLASDATGGSGALAPWIAALSPAVIVVGRAVVVGVGRDDNSPMREVPALATPGCVVVVGGAGESRTAVLGDLVARELLNAGVAAVVTDGLIRDAAAVAALGLPVWARGTTSVASRKDGVGYTGGVIPIGGAVVHDDDLVIADGDGVVVWPTGDVTELTERAEAKRQADDRRQAALDSER
jgi:regulator of RNase E activity RraA